MTSIFLGLATVLAGGSGHQFRTALLARLLWGTRQHHDVALRQGLSGGSTGRNAPGRFLGPRLCRNLEGPDSYSLAASWGVISLKWRIFWHIPARMNMYWLFFWDQHRSRIQQVVLFWSPKFWNSQSKAITATKSIIDLGCVPDLWGNMLGSLWWHGLIWVLSLRNQDNSIFPHRAPALAYI